MSNSSDKSALRKADIPTETIISVIDGSTCYVGQATALVIGGEDVIVLARHMDQLKKVTRSINPTHRFSEEAVHKVVMLAEKSAKLDDEL